MIVVMTEIMKEIMMMTMVIMKVMIWSWYGDDGDNDNDDVLVIVVMMVMNGSLVVLLRNSPIQNLYFPLWAFVFLLIKSTSKELRIETKSAPCPKQLALESSQLILRIREVGMTKR
jgi:hypothetical protein